EWQAIVKRFNFAVLRVTQANLDDFETAMVGLRRGIVRQINLHVELPAYDNGPCEKRETWEVKAENNACFSRAFYRLFHIMSRWSIEGVTSGGIDFSLSISSPASPRISTFSPHLHHHNRSRVAAMTRVASVLHV
ncbi:hypothetical protein LY78DRAFT_588302, partial [Colletotrichum sublineola]